MKKAKTMPKAKFNNLCERLGVKIEEEFYFSGDGETIYRVNDCGELEMTVPIGKRKNYKWVNMNEYTYVLHMVAHPERVYPVQLWKKRKKGAKGRSPYCYPCYPWREILEEGYERQIRNPATETDG